MSISTPNRETTVSAEQTVRFVPIPQATKPTIAPRPTPSPRPRKSLIKRIARRIVGQGILTKR